MTREEKAAYNKAHYKANKEKLAASQKAYREANKEKVAAYNRVYNKAYYKANKEKLAAYNKAHYEANKEKVLASKKVYNKVNKEKILAYKKIYREANKKKVAASKKSYSKANREKVLSWNARRRALRLEAIPYHIRECPFEKNRIIQIYKLRNLMAEITGIEHHVDHMWPLSKGGPHWSGNMQVIPASENLSKSDKLCRETKGVIEKALSNFVSERSI